MDLFELAVENSETLYTEYQELAHQSGTGNLSAVLKGFVERVKSAARLSFNMRQSTINGMMSSGKHKNMHELAAEERAKDPTKDREQILRERLKSYYEARMVFDHTFDDGEQFRYSALNIGGLGATHFGEYCVVLKQEFLETCSYLAFIRGDSLKGYVTGSTVDVDLLRKDVADRPHVHFLAALKHQGELQIQPSERWAVMMCGAGTYIEAVTKQAILVSVVNSVRISRRNHRQRFAELYNAYTGELTEAAQRRVDKFRELLQYLKRYGIELEIIDED